MFEHDYQNMMGNIQVPDGLETRVLAAAREKAAPKRTKQSWGKLAVCAACALALVVGGVNLWSGESEKIEYAETLSLPSLFTLTAYASELEEPLRPNANGALALLAGDGKLSREEGCYTGCLFQVEGENIETISLSVDRGGLYRSTTRTDLTKEEVRELLQAEAEGRLSTAIGGISGEDEDGPMTAVLLEDLGAGVTETYDPAAQYGFWVPPAEVTIDDQIDMAEEFHANVDVFDGAALTVTTVFADGTEQSRTYRLSTGRLRLVYQQDGSRLVLPQLAGDDETYVYGIYAEDQRESRWFSWPVEGANTISLSNPYGFRVKPGGLGETFHAGIDIPAPTGTNVTAAMAGTVTETGFDPDRGNYLLLDHGNGLTTLYAQCSTVEAEQGDAVEAGELIAAVGSTGKSTGPHLHFEVRQDGEAQDPVAYFDSAVRETLSVA